MSDAGYYKGFRIPDNVPRGRQKYLRFWWGRRYIEAWSQWDRDGRIGREPRPQDFHFVFARDGIPGRHNSTPIGPRPDFPTGDRRRSAR